MKIISTIKDRLEQNAQQTQILQGKKNSFSRQQQIRLEYLRIEAHAFNDMLHQLQTKRWSWLRNKRTSLILAIVAMSLYVLSVFHMFKELDLAKVEQWQFAMTALPFWLILILVPVAIITFLTTRSTRS